MKGRRRSSSSSRLALVFIAACFAVSSATTILAFERYGDRVEATSKAEFLALATTVDTQIQASQANEWQADAEKKRLADEEKAEKARAAAEAARNAASAASINSSDCNQSTSHNDPSQVDVLVNKKHCIQPLTFAPSDLAPVASGFQMKSEAALAYNQLSTAASNAGYDVRVTSAYRSYYDQVTTYDYWVGVSGGDGADTYSARPGYSEHQTGMAIDIAYGDCVLSCFGDPNNATSYPAYQWFEKHSSDYGFIQRYYKGYESITGYSAEEWHYRYVGVDTAKDMKAKGIKTLEQYWGMSGGDY